MPKEKFSITNLVNSDGCFDLQFRKDQRHERTGSPIYYRWKAQFIITAPKEQIALLKKAKSTLDCGSVSLAKNQARLSVQKLDDILEIIVPFFKKNTLSGKKKQCFDMWQKAVVIIGQNKGTRLLAWKKNDLSHLLEIHKSLAKYKLKPKEQKWQEVAKTLTKKPA